MSSPSTHEKASSHVDDAAADNKPSSYVLDADAAARFCGVSRAGWYKLRAAGCVPRPLKLGRRTLWRIEELKAWMDAGSPPMDRWDELARGRWK